MPAAPVSSTRHPVTAATAATAATASAAAAAASRPAAHGRPAARAWLLPYALLASFVIAILALLWFIHRHEREIEFNNLHRDTQLASLAVSRALLAHQEFASRLAGTLSSGLTPDTFSEQAEAYLVQHPEVLNAVWTRADGAVAWAAPAGKDAAAFARERPAATERARLLHLTRTSMRPAYTAPYRDAGGQPAIEYVSPVLERGEFHGTVSITFSLRAAIERLVPASVTGKYRLSLLDAAGTELLRIDDQRATHELLTQRAALSLPWPDLQLSATSYKTDSLLGRSALIGLILGITALLVWSLISLRRQVAQQLAADAELTASHERNRVQQEKLLLSSRLMSAGEMASTLAHEINQPLAAIANYNMGCVRRIKSGQWNEAELLSALEKSAAQAERAGKVVQRVREFLRRREPQREPCDLNAVVKEVTGLIEIEAERAGAIIEHDLAPGLPSVQADRVMLEQLLLNLVKNGLDAMHGTSAGSRTLTVSTRALDGALKVVVADCGAGVAPEVEAELFSPFFTTKEQGMGMGLNICRSIVELHEGRLWYEPAGGAAARGSSFHFTLPVT